MFVAPLAVLAAIFPATFGGLASGFRRWRAFMTVVSVNGILAAVYFFTQQHLPDEWWASATAFTALLLLVVLLGLVWAGHRYRAAVATDPAETDPPTKKDVFALLGFAAASVLVVFAVVYIGQWVMTGSPFGLPFGEVVALLFQLPTRELTAGIVGLLAAAGYLAYRTLRRPAEPEPSVRTRVAGETFALAAMLLFGGVMLVAGMPRAGTTVVGGGTAVANPAIKLESGGIWFESPDVEEVWSGVALTPTHAYFGGVKSGAFRRGAIVCVDRTTGQQKWVFSERGLRTVYCTPVVAGGRVYCGEGLHTDPDCRLFCLDAETGAKVWEFATASHTEGTPAVADGRVYFSAGDDGVYCVTTDGVRVWNYRGKPGDHLHVDSPVVVANGRVYAGSGYHTLAAFCLDAASGAEVWKKELPLRSFGPPVVSGERVFFGTGTGALLTDLSTEPEPGRPPETAPAGAVVCLSATTGDTLWKHDLPRSAHTQMAADEFAVYAASRDGWLYALGRESGWRLWRFDYRVPLTTGVAAGRVPERNVFRVVYSAHPAGLVQAHAPLTGEVFWSRGLAEFTDRIGDDPQSPPVPTGPTVDASADGRARQVFVPVTLTNTNNKAKRAAILRFVDTLAE